MWESKQIVGTRNWLDEIMGGPLTLSRSTSVINIPNSEHIHASDKYILSFISVRSFANKKGLSFVNYAN